MIGGFLRTWDMLITPWPRVINERQTSQFPPPTTRCPSITWLPKVNILSSPFWMTTNTSIQALLLALLPAVSLYCLRHSIPSFAHGGPRSASSSSVILMVVSAESSLRSLRSSSSCVSRIIVYERFEANPSAGVNKDLEEPCIFCRDIVKLFSNREEVDAHIVSRCGEAWSGAGTSIDATVTAVRTHPIRCPKNRLDTANAAPLERCQTILLYP